MSERVLVVLAADLHVRNFVTSGALDEIEGEVLFVVSAGRVSPDSDVRKGAGYLGEIEEGRLGIRLYAWLELLWRAARRRRSPTLATKLSLTRRRTRAALKVLALPGVRRPLDAALRAMAAANRDLGRLFDEASPDVLLVPTGGNDPLVNQAIRAARRRRIASLAVMVNWDGLTSKGALIERPDRVGVWGERTASDARRVHGLPAERIDVIGSPTLDRYMHPAKEIGPSPFPKPYALIAGAYTPYDEARLVEELRAARRDTHLDIALVYRPHPYRAPRRRPDRVLEGDGVILDPAVADAYVASFEPGGRTRERASFPPLSEYLSLLHNASFVISPLSTMVLEAALIPRPVIAVTADDGLNRPPMSTVARYEHFAGLAEATPVSIASSYGELRDRFGEAAREAAAPPSRDPSLNLIVWSDRSTFAERMKEWVRGAAQNRD